MLRITVDILPRGDVARARTIAVGYIWNKSRDKQGYVYGVCLSKEKDTFSALEAVKQEQAQVRGYPRWSAPVWDLVARCVHRAMSPRSRNFNLGPLPMALYKRVPVLEYENISYVRVADVPEFAREEFVKYLSGQACPLIPGEDAPDGCAYVSDFYRFLGQ